VAVDYADTTRAIRGTRQGKGDHRGASFSRHPQADITRIERGAGNPTGTTMQRLAHALNGRLQLVTA
jgi:hypothetical protein